MIGIGLYKPKFDPNIGGVLRAAGCYGANFIAIAGNRARRNIKGHGTDTSKMWRHIPVIETNDLFLTIPVGCVPIAVDLIEGATPLQEFDHPKNAFYIFGPEDGTLGQQITDRCPHKIFIPTNRCMNLAATANVVLYDRLAKKLRKENNDR